MAKTRAQRKAERRKRQEQQLQERARGSQARAQESAAAEEARERTQVPESGDVAEVEAVMETGADVADYGEHVVEELPEAAAAPAPSRADVGAPAEAKQSRREQRRAERERRRRAQESADRRKPQERTERRRGPVVSFFVSVWRELQRVQWPDRETLIQASAVTLLFVAVAAAYLGALDAVFSRLVKLII
jgi:preprotein translocase SecE subunit